MSILLFDMFLAPRGVTVSLILQGIVVFMFGCNVRRALCMAASSDVEIKGCIGSVTDIGMLLGE